MTGNHENQCSCTEVVELGGLIWFADPACPIHGDQEIMATSEIRDMLAEFERNSQKTTDPIILAMFSGGISALKMVLGDDE